MAEAYATLLVEAEGPVLWVRLNRPEVRNAYTAEMGADLVRALAQADADDDIRVVVLTATGRCSAPAPISRPGRERSIPRAEKARRTSAVAAAIAQTAISSRR